MDSKFRVGVVFPQTEIGEDPFVIRDFAQAVEGMGYSHLVAYDHVLGANTASRPEWQGPYTHQSMFHEPLTLFSYLAGLTTKLGLMSGVIILPQRQTALVAKQAANVDVFSRGRLQLGVGIGWNEVEYEALGMEFSNKGKRLDDQIRILRRLWTEPTFTARTPFHTISDAGLNPLPVQRPIPIFVGGFSEAASKRAAALGDGWFPAFTADKAEQVMTSFRQKVADAKRAPGSVALENCDMLGTTLGGPVRNADAAVADVAAWRKAGANGLALDTMNMGLKHDARIALLRRISEML